MTDPGIVTAWRTCEALCLLGGFAFLGYSLSLWIGPRRPLAYRLSASLVVATWLATALFHGLIAGGQFRIGVALVVLGIACAATLRWAVPPPVLACRWRRDREVLRAWMAACRPWPVRLTGIVFLIFALLAVLRAALLPPLGWDTLTYHGVKAGIWVQQGRFDLFAAPGGWGSKALLPGGGEVLLAWAMLPFRSDLAVGFVDAFFWLVTGWALVDLGRQLRIPRPHGLVAAVYVLFIPALRLSVGTGYGEPVLLAMLMLGLRFAAGFLVQGAGASLLLALMALGVAAGVKSTAWTLAAWTVLVLVLSGRFRRGGWLWLIAGFGCAAAVVLPWLWFSFLRTGYPLSPHPVQLGRWVLGVASESVRWYHHRAEVPVFDLAKEWHVLFGHVFVNPWKNGPQLSLSSLLPLVLGVAAFPVLLRRGWRCAVLLGGWALAVAAFFFSSQFHVVRLLWAPVTGRFLLPLLAPLVVLSFVVFRSRGRASRIYAAALLAGALVHAARTVFFGWAAFEWKEVPAAGAILVAAVGVAWFLARRARAFGAAAGMAAACVVGLAVLLQSQRDAYRYRAVRQQSTVLHDIPVIYWERAAREVDEPGRSQHRIAVTSGIWRDCDNWFLYYFLGRRFQNELTYVPATAGGEIMDFGPENRLKEEALYEPWVARLVERGITHVMSFEPESVEHGWMASRPERFEYLKGEGRNWGLFRVRP